MKYEVIDRENGNGSLDMESNCRIGRQVSIDITADVTIGSGVMVCEGVLILTHEHSPRDFFNRELISKSPLVIEDDVFIGTRAIITAGCNRIRQGTVIGAGAVVTKNTEPLAVYGGNPAKFIKSV